MTATTLVRKEILASFCQERSSNISLEPAALKLEYAATRAEQNANKVRK